MDAPEPAGPRPDLTGLFAAEDSPMLGGLVLRLVAVGSVVVLAVWLVRRRRRP